MPVLCDETVEDGISRKESDIMRHINCKAQWRDPLPAASPPTGHHTTQHTLDGDVHHPPLPAPPPAAASSSPTVLHNPPPRPPHEHTPLTHHSPHLYSPLNTMMSSSPCHLTTVAHLTLTTHPITTRQQHTKHPPPTPVTTPPITVVDSCFRTSTVPSRPPTSFIMSLN